MEQSEPKPKILFLDDDKFFVNVYTLKFTHAGYEFETAKSVNEALTILRGGFVPDVIICDLTMEQATGFDFLNIIRTEKLAPDAYRIVLTNQADNTDKVHAQELGADRYIVKATMIPDEVVSVVEEALALRKQSVEKK